LACVLFPGALAAENLIHVVTRGETIYSISRFYGVNANELTRVNDITDPSRLFVGRRLIIPQNEDAASSAGSVLPSSVTTAPLIDYQVARGDTLYGIARARGITLQALLDINKFSASYSLRAGEIIKVPEQIASSPVPPANAPVGGLYALRWPVTPRLITYMTGEMGVVVEGAQNESVRSITQGSVVSAGPWRKYGRVVIIEAAGGYFYMYGGCETITVNVGDRITSGMEIGKLGINAVTDRPQLFFMVFRNDLPLDPASAPRS